MVTHKRPVKTQDKFLSFELESSGELGTGKGFMEKVTRSKTWKVVKWGQKKKTFPLREHVEPTEGRECGQ